MRKIKISTTLGRSSRYKNSYHLGSHHHLGSLHPRNSLHPHLCNPHLRILQVVKGTCYKFCSSERRDVGRTTTTTTAAAAARIGDVDADPAAIEFCIIHAGNGSLGLLVTAVSHKTKAAGALRLAITHHDRLFHPRHSGTT